MPNSIFYTILVIAILYSILASFRLVDFICKDAKYFAKTGKHLILVKSQKIPTILVFFYWIWIIVRHYTG